LKVSIKLSPQFDPCFERGCAIITNTTIPNALW